jgi:CHRD domain/PEP-CTERM motif
VLAAAAALSLSLPASAAISTFSTSLSGAGEPVPTSTATGSATVSFDDVLFTVGVDLSFAGLASSSPFGHIHCCTATAGSGNAGVKVEFTGFPAVATGDYVKVFMLSSSAFSTLLAGVQEGRAYVNIHTPGTYQSGEIRGFLAPVPEPGTYALMLAGLGVLGWAAKRRQQRQVDSSSARRCPASKSSAPV